MHMTHGDTCDARFRTSVSAHTRARGKSFDLLCHMCHCVMRCDKSDHTDEVIQAIGRGRGVNRTADTPLEVQVLADVALPLVHDRVVTWEVMCPDIVQRMLLAGVAVNSPADAVVLHAALFPSSDAFESAFRRVGFNRQNPIDNTYRGMTVKSARYSKGGRGHGLQTAYWLDGDAATIRATVEQALGPLAAWDESC
jgi:hypothetical protein